MKRNIILTILFATLTAVAGNIRTVTVMPTVAVTTNWIGNGIQWAPYPHCDTTNTAKGFTYGPITDAQLQRVMDRLDVMQPQFMRIMIEAGWRYLEGFDEYGKPVVNYDNEEMRFLYRILDYCQSRNIAVVYGEWHPRVKKSSGASSGEWVTEPLGYHAVWATMIADVLHHLLVEKGYTCIRYYDLENEPYGDWSYSKGCMEKYASAMKLLHEALVAKGIRDKIALDCSWGNETGSMGLSPDELRMIAPYADIYDEHHYHTSYPDAGTDWEKDMRQRIRMVKSGDPQAAGVFIGETNFKIGYGTDGRKPQFEYKGKKVPYVAADSTQTVFEWENGVAMALNAVQKMRAGILGVIAWDLDDAMHTGDDDGVDMKRWGCFDSMGGTYSHMSELEELRPWFYTWALMCRSFPRDMTILDVENGLGDGISATAGNVGKKWIVALVNYNDDARKVQVKIENGPENASLKKYIYFKDRMPVDQDGYPVPAETKNTVNTRQGIDVDFPGKGFVLLELNQP